MGKSIRLLRIKGIPIGLHPSWFLIFLFLTWSLATGYFPTQVSSLSVMGIWALGLFTSLLFFASVLAHELGHAFVALRNNIPVKSISLFFLGGLARIGREPSKPGEEFRIAIAGPIVSLALAGFFSGLGQLGGSLSYLGTAAAYLGSINLLLGLFNLIPGFPMDGGRILRAIIWKLSGDFYRASQIASFTGQLVAYGFIGYGIFTIFTSNFMNGLWLGFIGWFLLNVAASASAQARLQQKLSGVMVDQVMKRDYPSVQGETTLDQLVNGTLAGNSNGMFLVVGNEDTAGFLTLREITKIPRHLWSRIKAKEVMKPWGGLTPVSSDMPVLTALEKMEEAHQTFVPVVDGAQVRGILSREQVRRYLKLRSELGM